MSEEKELEQPEIDMGDGSMFNESLSDLFDGNEVEEDEVTPEEAPEPEGAIPEPTPGNDSDEVIQQADQAVQQANARADQAEDAVMRRDWDTATADLGRTKTELESKQKQLEDAIDEGDSKAQARLQNEMGSLHNRHRDIESYLTKFAQNNVPQQPQQAQQQPQQQQPQQPQPVVDSLGDSYSANNQWTKDPRYKADYKRLHAMAQGLMNEGYSESSQEFYTELHSRFDKTNPGLFRHPTGQVAPAQESTQRRQVVDPNDRGDVTALTPGKQKLTLTARDKTVMRNFGLDPNNKVERTEFLKNRNEGEKQLARRGA